MTENDTILRDINYAFGPSGKDLNVEIKPLSHLKEDLEEIKKKNAPFAFKALLGSKAYLFAS